MAPILDVRGLMTAFPSASGLVNVLDGVDFEVQDGEILGIVGESGSGKTMTALSITGLLPRTASVRGGEILYRGSNLLALDDRAMNRIRGEQISMIFQNPRASLNPLYRVETTLDQVLRTHRGLRGAAARRVAVDLLVDVGLPDPERVLRRYPHELSGGMCQRVMIALALASEPSLLIADEPTTALDVTVQLQIIQLLSAPAGGARADADPDHAQPQRRRRALRPSGRDVPRPDRRGGPGARDLRPRRGTRTRSGCSRPARAVHLDGTLAVIPGSVPDLRDRPPGCPFHPRCSYAQERLLEGRARPRARAAPAHFVECHFWREVA